MNMKLLHLLLIFLVCVGIAFTADVDVAPGSHATGFGGGGSGGGGKPPRRPGPIGGHKGQGKLSQQELEIETILRMARSKTAMWLQQNLQIRRELSWRKSMSINFRGHTTFPEAGLLQLLGNQNARSCTRCQNGAGPFSQCISFHEPMSDELPNPPADMPLPYGGSCGNCYWNGQGSLCSLRPGGASIPPRRRRAPLYQSTSHGHTRVGSRFNLDTPNGIREAMNEQQGVINALRRRGNLLKSGHPVPDIREDSSPDDDDSHITSGDEDMFDLGGPPTGPYSTRLRSGSSSHPATPQHIRFNSSDFQPGGSMAGRAHGHVRFHSNGSVFDIRSSGMQIQLPSRSGAGSRPGTPNSPRSQAGSPMDTGSRAGSPAFFDFDHGQAPGASFGGPLRHPQPPSGPSGQGSSSHARTPSNLRKNFETESDEEEYQPPGSGGSKRR